MPPSSTQPLLLVDGYNVIGSWFNLKKTRDRNELATARRDLVEVLINYSAFKGFNAQVVFDAHYQNTPGYQEAHTSHLSVYYTAFSQSADTYIEKVCASLAHQLQYRSQRLIVVTSDWAQQQTVIGYGAEWRSAQRLAGEVDIATRRGKRKHQPQKQYQGRFLINSLDAKAQQRLAQWRNGKR